MRRANHQPIVECAHPPTLAQNPLTAKPDFANVAPDMRNTPAVGEVQDASKWIAKGQPKGQLRLAIEALEVDDGFESSATRVLLSVTAAQVSKAFGYTIHTSKTDSPGVFRVWRSA